MSTNVSGGGFQNDVTIDRSGTVVYAAGDVSGIAKSTNGGALFSAHNKGLTSLKVASIATTPDNQQIIYAGAGDKGTSGGLYRSINGGVSWTLAADGADAKFSGNHPGRNDPVPQTHPRSNGDLIVIDPGSDPTTYTDDTVIAGSYRNGLQFFTRGGDRKVSAISTNGFVRSIAINASLPKTVFAAIQFPDRSKNGIYRIQYTNIRRPTSQLVYRSQHPEGVTVLSNGHVYAAIGTDGIARYDGESWERKTNGLSTGDTHRVWTAVSGYVLEDKDIVYAGTNNISGFASGEFYSSVWRSVDSGDNWSALVDAKKNVFDTIHGTTESWWFRQHAFPQAGLGRTNSIVSDIEVAVGTSVDQVYDDIIFVSGRGGIWKSGDGGDTWAPAVNNLQATSNNAVAAHISQPNQIVLANTDYVALFTNDGFEGNDVMRDKPANAESKAYDVIFDAHSNEFIIGAGNRDRDSPGGGEVYKKPASALGRPSEWIKTGLSLATAPRYGRVRAVGHGYHDGMTATSQTILAAVEGDGIYRYHNEKWSRSIGVDVGSTKRSQFAWPDNNNSGTVYFQDLTSGLYRSRDGGQSWDNIWPTMVLRNNDYYNTGYIAHDDNHPTTLYISIQGDRSGSIDHSFKVFRLTDADTRIFGDLDDAGITDISVTSDGSPIKRPGPLKIDHCGRLWLAQQQDSRNNIDAALYVMFDPTQDSSFTNVTTKDYERVAVAPSGMDVSSNGYIYLSQNGPGLVKIALPDRFMRRPVLAASPSEQRGDKKVVSTACMQK